MADDIDGFLAENPFSACTIERYGRALRLAVGQLELETMTAIQLREWLDRQGWGDSARWVAYSAIKGYLRWRYGAGHPALRLRIKRAEPPPGRALTLTQVQLLLSSFDTSRTKGRRDLAIACAFLDSAFRVSEVARLDLADVSLEQHTARVVVKGGKWRVGYLSDYTCAYIATWLADRASLVRPGCGALFVSVGGGSAGERLTVDGLKVTVKRWGVVAGLQLSPHDLRRTFGNLATRAGAPQRIAMTAGRWESESAFRRYTLDIGTADIAAYTPVVQAMR